MKRNRILALLLALVMVLSLCACGKKEENAAPAPSKPAASEPAAPKGPDAAGKYTAVQAVMMGMTMAGDDVPDFQIDLKDGGKGTVTIDGDSDETAWTLSGDQLTLEVDGEKMTGKLDGDVIVFDDMLGMGFQMTFARDGSPSADPALWVSAEAEAAEAELIGVWTSYEVLDLMDEDASGEYDPEGMVLDIREDNTVGCYWQGQDLGDQEWNFMGGSVYLDNGIDFSFTDSGDLEVCFNDYDICPSYLTYHCRKGGEVPADAAPASGGEKSGDDASGGDEPSDVYAGEEGRIPAVGIPGGVLYDCIGFSLDAVLYRSDGTWMVLGDSAAAISFEGGPVVEYDVQTMSNAVIFHGGDDSLPTGLADGDMIVLNREACSYYMLKDGGTPGPQYDFLNEAELLDPPVG